MRDYLTTHAASALTIGGFLIGLALGAIVFRTNFCAMGSVSDMVSFGDSRRFRAWLLAAATAVVGAQWLAHIGVVELGRSIYLTPSFNWSGNILGGLLFGIGMVFGGGCATRNLARVGGGDMRALLTLIVLGISAYIALGGIFGPVRAALESTTAVALTSPSQGLPDLAGLLVKGRPGAARLMLTALVVGILLAYCFSDVTFRSAYSHIASGVGVGLCIVAGWALTGLTYDELASRPSVPISLTFVRPTGDALEWLQRSTALGLPGFGVATVFGTIVGAFIVAKATGQFRLATFSDKGDTLRNLGGAVLMGVGGIMALGCTIGQGITGISTLSAGSFLTFAALVAGAVIGVRALEALLLREA